MKTSYWHNYSEGDCGKPIDRHGKHLCYYKKGFWKRYDRRKYLKKVKNYAIKEQDELSQS